MLFLMERQILILAQVCMDTQRDLNHIRAEGVFLDAVEAPARLVTPVEISGIGQAMSRLLENKRTRDVQVPGHWLYPVAR